MGKITPGLNNHTSAMSFPECVSVQSTQDSLQSILCCKNETLIVERGVIQARYSSTPSCLRLFEEQNNLGPVLGGLFSSLAVFILALSVFLYLNRTALVRYYSVVHDRLSPPVLPVVVIPAIIPEATYAECDIYPACLNPFVPEFHDHVPLPAIPSQPISISGPSLYGESTLQGVISLPDDDAISNADDSTVNLMDLQTPRLQSIKTALNLCVDDTVLDVDEVTVNLMDLQSV